MARKNTNDDLFDDDLGPSLGGGSSPSYYETEGLLKNDVEVTDEVSKVASKPGRNIAMLIAMVIAAGLFLYFVIFKSGGDVEPQQKDVVSDQVGKTVPGPSKDKNSNIEVGVVEPIEVPELSEIKEEVPLPPIDQLDNSTKNTTEIEPLPDLDKVAEPELIPEKPKAEIPPPPPQEIPTATLPATPAMTPEAQAAIDAKRKSDMMLMNGGVSATTGQGGVLDFGAGTGIGYDSIKKTAAEQAVATKIGDTSAIIAQGKIIDAVLETAINTDLPGVLRAVVSRDIYAEAGNAVLIPKGSRLIGDYDATVKRGQRRVYIIWNRIIRPDGIDVDVKSPGIDQLGRAGAAGHVDNRYLEIFGNSVLLSALTIAGAYGLEEVTNSGNIGTSNTNTAEGSTTQTQNGSPTGLAIADAVTDISDVSQKITSSMIDSQPIITVPQGSRVKVFVNKDLVFPDTASMGYNIVR